jgi:hypothetical protein
MLSGLQPFTTGSRSAARRSPPQCWLYKIALAPGATLQAGDLDVQPVGWRDNSRLISAGSDRQIVASATRWTRLIFEPIAARILTRFDGVRPTDSSSTPQYVLVTCAPSRYPGFDIKIA